MNLCNFIGMFNGLRKMVGSRGSTESLDETPEINPATPCLTKTAKKRKVLDGHGFSAKKKYVNLEVNTLEVKLI